jgi:hypothetical protein
MADEATNYLDLDSIVPEKEIVVKLAGIKHNLVPISVEGFIANIQKIKDFSDKVDANEIDEKGHMAFTVDMLVRAFPTMTSEMLMKLPMPSLAKLFEFAQLHNGSKKVETEAAADAEANPPQTAQ